MARGSTRRALVVTGETSTIVARYRVEGVRGFRDAFLGYTVGRCRRRVRAGAERRHAWRLLPPRPLRVRALVDQPGPGRRFPPSRGARSTRTRAGTAPACGTPSGRVDPDIGLRVYRETGTTVDDYALFVVHQVTAPLAEEFVERLGLPRDRVMFTVADHGNVAAASLPLGLSLAREEGRVRRGDRVLFFGLGAGLSVATLALVL